MKKLILTAIICLLSLSRAIAADSSVPGMGAGGTISGTDGWYCIQGGGTTEHECTATQLSTYILSTWGVITSGDIIVGGGSGGIQDVSGVTSAFTTGLSSTKTFAYGAGANSSSAIDGNWWQNGATGTSTDINTTTYHNWTITNDGVDASASANGVEDFLFASACCGSTAKNGRQLVNAFLNINHAPADTGANYTAFSSFAQASVNVGGTTGAGNGLGALFGGQSRAILQSGGTFWHRVNGHEIDTDLPTGASADVTVGLNIVQTTGSTVSPNIADYGIVIGSGVTGLSGRDFMMTDGSYDGYPALKTGGTWFSCYPHANNNSTNPCGAIGSFADLSNFSSVSGNILLGPASNGKIDGNFNFFGGLESLTSTTTPTMAAGTLALTGIATAPTFAANGEGAFWLSSTLGLVMGGQGSTNDFTVVNKTGATVFSIATSAAGVTSSGAMTAQRFVPTSSTVATNGMYLPAANTVGISANTTLAQSWTSTGTTVASLASAGTQCVQASSAGLLSGTGSACGGSGSSGANPTATAGPTAVNGSATTFMRSDGAPAVQKGSNAQFGIVEGDGSTVTCVSGVCTAIPGVTSRTATTTDTILSTDRGNVVFYNSASSIAVTQPAPSGSFATGFFTTLCNINAGVATVTPGSGTVYGGSTLAIAGGTAGKPNCVAYQSDGTNFNAVAPQLGALATVTAGANVATAAAVALSGAGGLTSTIFHGTAALGTGAITSGTCATAVNVTAANVATTDIVTAGFSADPTATTGYLPTAMLTIVPYVASAGNIGVKVCNLTASTITPSAVTINISAVR